MESIKNIFKVGKGPSSSHTMGPRTAALKFLERNNGAARFDVTLYGSLAATGIGHLTDVAILEVLGGFTQEEIANMTIEELRSAGKSSRCKLNFRPETFLPQHPNGLFFEAYDSEGRIIDKWTTFSIGGGDISDSGKREESKSIYPHGKMDDILAWCKDNGTSFWEYVALHEDKDIWDYLAYVWDIMKQSIARGLENEGVLPGGLNLARRAASYHIKSKGYQGSMQRRGMTFSYALAVAEENASGGIVVTAPTCGSCGVIPAVLHLTQKFYDFSDKRIIRGLATAGLIGNIIKTNASISGAEVGCQGEIGSACSMASGAGVQIFGGTPAQVEYAASIGMEHFLGLTCDPVGGLVQIPCIERNAFAATRAIDADVYALMSDGSHRISFDTVVEVMKRTGRDLPSLYKETAEGGLAYIMSQK
ncbi:MAG: L-serine ammonia-lyase [Bacteroidales bacterium]|nr:L-serine ammonia-lyase [Bacteroidales bacterium]